MESNDSPAPPHGPDCTVEQARTIPYLVAFGVIYVGAIVALRFLPLPQAGQVIVALLLVLTLGLLELSGALRVGAIDYLELWPMIFWLYFVGLFAARKRYR
jgi:hypothetical protein